MISSIGWLATAIVTSSYFFHNHKTLRALQALGAIVWLTYGVLINSKPVMVANIIVAVVAAYSIFMPNRVPPPNSRRRRLNDSLRFPLKLNL